MSPGRQRWTLVAACLAQFMILLDLTIVNVALPSIQRELDVTSGTLVWTINAYTLSLASFILVGGTLGDRYGRKRIFALGFALFTLFSAGCALSTSDHMLVAFRGLQGVGAALLAPLSLSILADAFEPDRRGGGVGVWGKIARVGLRGGALVGGGRGGGGGSAGVGDRDLGNDRRLRIRARPCARRRAGRGLRLVGDLLGERSVRHRGPCYDAHPRARVARSERPPARSRGSRSHLGRAFLPDLGSRRDR